MTAKTLGVWTFAFVSAFLLVSVLAGCGDDGGGSPPPPGDPDAGGRDGGLFGGGDRDGATDAAVPLCDDAEGPQVEVVEPAAATDPSSEAVVTSERLSVDCRVTRAGVPSARPVDADSISIVRVDEGGSVVDSPAVDSRGDGLYRASFALGDVPNGPLRFVCTAEDTADEPRCGQDELRTLLDLGPTIEVVHPEDGSVHASGMSLDYWITEAPIAEGDGKAAVAAHELVIAGVSISDVEEVEPGRFNASIDFTDRSTFAEALAGPYELVITAENMRTPEPGVRVHRQELVVDSEGPTIDMQEPGSGELVGGRVRVVADVTDPAGLEEDSIVLRIGAMEWAMRRVEDGGDAFEVFFDASAFPSTVTDLTLNVTASDIVGNRATASLSVKLDSVAPIASLDPPAIREGRVRGGVLECSTLFDPVGSDSVDDGQVVGTAAEFRARAQDLGNSSFGSSGTVTFLAGMRQVDLYLLDETDVPLLVDESGDGTCDAINPDVAPGSGGDAIAAIVELEPVDATGSAYFAPEAEEDVTVPGEPESAYGGVYGDCSNGNDSSSPDPICPSSALTRVVPSPLIGGPPTIFAKPPIDRSSGLCVGDAFDFQPVLSEGWACLAVRAEDELGNANVSPPLRACFIDGMEPDPCPGSVGTVVAEEERPQCTDGCTPPPSFVDYPGLQLIVPD